jgi:hypothetical protein
MDNNILLYSYEIMLAYLEHFREIVHVNSLLNGPFTFSIMGVKHYQMTHYQYHHHYHHHHHHHRCMTTRKFA